MKYYGNDPLVEGSATNEAEDEPGNQRYPHSVLDPRRYHRRIQVVKIDSKGRIVRQYPSVSAAAKAEGIKQASMSIRIKKRITIDGYMWLTNGGRA